MSCFRAISHRLKKRKKKKRVATRHVTLHANFGFSHYTEKKAIINYLYKKIILQQKLKVRKKKRK